MDIEDFKNLAQLELENALLRYERQFNVNFDEMLCEPGDGFDCEFSGTFEITFEYGNCKRIHIVQIDSIDLKTVGIGYGEDGDVFDITHGNLMGALYSDLALDGLDDKYLT